jgi:PAS domain S-box-containing protein
MAFRDILARFSHNLLLTALLLIPLALVFIIYVHGEKQIDRANDLRHVSLHLSVELRQSSDDLTRLARTYVITGEPLYKKQYQDILDIRDGKKPRPEDYWRVYWDLIQEEGQPPRPDTARSVPLIELMREHGFSEQELAKMTTAKSNSDRLAVTEKEAMKLSETSGPGAEAAHARARAMMYDRNYYRAKADIMRPIDEVYVLMEKRTTDAVHSAENMAMLLRMILIGFALWLLLMLWLTYKALRKTLGGSIDEVYAQIVKMGQGDFSSDLAVNNWQNDSVMRWLAETQVKLSGNAQERKNAENSLRESNAYLENLINYANAPIIVWDSSFIITRFNHAFETLTGRSAAEVCGGRISMLFPVDQVESSMELINKTITGERWETVEIPILHKNGTISTVLWNSATIFPSDGTIPVATIAQGNDITKRKQAERELQDKNIELEHFTYSVSHDLKSPLITIQSYAGQIMQDVDDGHYERIHGDLKRIIHASSKMTNLLNDLLELSRIGKMMGTPERIDMVHMANDVLKQLAGPLSIRSVEVVVQPDLPEIYGDQVRIMMVLQNLVENAAKYMGDQPSPRITIGSRATGSTTVFFVSDNGQGVEQRFHEDIFGLFNKLDPRSKGTGVGLAMVKRIVEVHGGRVWVESEGEGTGSTFCFTLSRA